MIILLFLALTVSNPLPRSLLKNTTEAASIFHEKCVQILPTESVNRATLSALLCGENITDANLKKNLVKTSLIHIFVISGSHLILLDEFLSILKIPFFLRFLLLSFYSLTVGWQPPAVRALFALGVRELFKNLHWKFPPDLLVLAAGLLTLSLFPLWWESPSLVMSWSAALALCGVSVLGIRNRFQALILSQLVIYLFMSVPLWGLGNLHPLSLIYNLLLAPAIALGLLPLAFFGALIPPLLPLFDSVLSFFTKLLALVSEPVATTKSTPLDVFWLWIWVFAWQIFFHGLRLYRRQGKDATR